MCIRKFAIVFDVGVQLVEERDGFISAIIDGDLFRGETGGHRWQRVSPTEKSGRIHTSTITVAVLLLEPYSEAMANIRIELTHGSGKGGQNRNKVETCVVAIDDKTGLKVRIDSQRSQYQNKVLAIRMLKAKLKDLNTRIKNAELNSIRANQVGSGERGDKIRTYRQKDNLVIDHRTGKKFRLSDWQKGLISG